ncbi:MAG TPA: hypothetical protein VE869_04000 [Gemmatimonas sp.]|nr:hypothetical protein [Gemmatimonas sp.]
MDVDADRVTPRVRRSSGRARIRAGFSLAELLATMTLLGLVGAMCAKLMMGQQRFYHRQNEQVGVRRELRTAMSLIPADLRGVSSSGGDITALAETGLTFRNVLGASIVCAKPDNSTLHLPPLNMAKSTLTAWYTEPVAGDSVFAFDEGMLRGAEDDAWVARVITGVSPDAALCPASPYTDALDAGKSRWRVTVTPAFPDSVKIGAAVRFMRSTRYSLGAQASGKYYLSRAEYTGGGWTAPIPVSGPYDAPASGKNGVQFRYFDSTGVQVTSVADSRRVARIDLVLRATGASTSGDLGTGRAVKDSLAFRIALRNRQ